MYAYLLDRGLPRGIFIATVVFMLVTMLITIAQELRARGRPGQAS
jgi:hypothetical protein